ncbi:hypothetical protein LCGC14_0479750 [marine sediment metagenome]|uniref:Uncharacterized protein n=1 Tax=marine sediment metagenome TaxID=412755 RepID=A0A0F9SF49_9ZZZZ
MDREDKTELAKIILLFGVILWPYMAYLLIGAIGLLAGIGITIGIPIILGMAWSIFYLAGNK